jgi:hypothetical protein
LPRSESRRLFASQLGAVLLFRWPSFSHPGAANLPCSNAWFLVSPSELYSSVLVAAESLPSERLFREYLARNNCTEGVRGQSTGCTLGLYGIA